MAEGRYLEAALFARLAMEEVGVKTEESSYRRNFNNRLETYGEILPEFADGWSGSKWKQLTDDPGKLLAKFDDSTNTQGMFGIFLRAQCLTRMGLMPDARLTFEDAREGHLDRDLNRLIFISEWMDFALHELKDFKNRPLSEIKKLGNIVPTALSPNAAALLHQLRIQHAGQSGDFETASENAREALSTAIQANNSQMAIEGLLFVITYANLSPTSDVVIQFERAYDWFQRETDSVSRLIRAFFWLILPAATLAGGV